MIKSEFQLVVPSNDMSVVTLLEETFLESDISLSRQEIKQIMQKGCVWLDNGKYTRRLRRAKKALSKGDKLFCYYDESVLSEVPPDATLISDEGEYSIWNKPAGMLSQGSKWGDHCTIHRWVEKHLKPERQAFIVHRLDRAASGLIILAHKKKVAAKFSLMFKNREIEKHYAVTVVGDLKYYAGFDKSLKDNVLTIDQGLDGKVAISHIKLLAYNSDKNESILDVHIETGRKHQIRQHLSGIGYPVVGDRLYGDTKDLKREEDTHLQLNAVSLNFICPVKDKNKSYKI